MPGGGIEAKNRKGLCLSLVSSEVISYPPGSQYVYDAYFWALRYVSKICFGLLGIPVHGLLSWIGSMGQHHPFKGLLSWIGSMGQHHPFKGSEARVPCLLQKALKFGPLVYSGSTRMLSFLLSSTKDAPYGPMRPKSSFNEGSGAWAFGLYVSYNGHIGSALEISSRRAFAGAAGLWPGSLLT